MKDLVPFSLLFALTILLSILTAFPEYADAQSRVTINRAQEVVGATMEGERVRKLIGDVSLRTQNMVMYCDSAYQYLEKSEVRAFGNIEIDTQEERVFADTLVYFTDVDFSQLRGRVVIETDSSTLFSEAVDYRFSTKVGHFLRPVRLEDQDGILTARGGFYYREADSAVFRGDVQLTDSLKYAEGDSLFINRKKNTYRLYGNVFVDDRENNVKLSGDSLKADSTGHRYLEGNAWLQRVEQPETAQDTLTAESPPPAPDTTRAPFIPTRIDSLTADSLRRMGGQQPPVPSDTLAPPRADTTHIRARLIHSVETDSQETINAYREVRIWSSKFSALADTLLYDDRTEIFRLISNPVAWHKEIQLTGPYIEVRMIDSEIDRLIAYPSPFVVQRDTVLGRLNQMKGDTLRAYFTDGDISRIHIQPNSHLLRFTKNDQEEPDGAIDMTAPSLRIFFAGGELTEMNAKGPVDGTYLPESEQTAERKLEGFVWNPDQRPERPASPLRRRLPPIPETPHIELPKHYLQRRAE